MPNVKVTQPSVIQVKVGNATNPQATAIAYGGKNGLLKSAGDLSFTDAVDGGVITWHSATGIFTINATSPVITDIDNGFF